MRYSIHHRTTYRYADHVSDSHHLVHLAPRASAGQRTLSSSMKVSPEPDVFSAVTDYYGNLSHFFSITTPHKQLTIDSYSEVDVDPMGGLPLELSQPWEGVRDALQIPTLHETKHASEFCFATALCPRHPKLADYARQSFTPGRPVLAATSDLTQRIFDDFSFDTTATVVSTPVMTVFEKRAGVCQDFAHLQVSCLRSLGLAARYVSGYIRTNPPEGKVRLIGADASHAWIAVYVPTLGWVEFDATNNVQPSLDHIRVAYGRDYNDVCPVRGTVYGGGRQQLKIGVTVTPQAEFIPFG